MPKLARIILGVCIALVGIYLGYIYTGIFIRITIYFVTLFTIVVVDSVIETLLEQRKLK